MNVIRECTNPDCTFRYPDLNIQTQTAYCPKCGATAVIREYFSRSDRQGSDIEISNIAAEFQVVLDNIRSIYNVGSIFRTADGFGIRKIHLCGITPTPANPRFLKTGLMPENQIEWEHHPNGLIFLRVLKQAGFQIFAIENIQNSVPLYSCERISVKPPVALIAGNENIGIDPEILRNCDIILSIPMLGHKQSFNVAVALGITLSYFYSLLVI